jgi:hypothetical protein
MSQQKTGTGTIITSPSRQSSASSTAPSPSSMTNDNDTSTTPKATKSQSRSVSEVTRVIRLPVFFREKNDRLRRWMCSYNSARRSRATHSPITDISRSRRCAAACRIT